MATLVYAGLHVIEEGQNQKISAPLLEIIDFNPKVKIEGYPKICIYPQFGRYFKYQITCNYFSDDWKPYIQPPLPTFKQPKLQFFGKSRLDIANTIAEFCRSLFIEGGGCLSRRNSSMKCIIGDKEECKCNT